MRHRSAERFFRIPFGQTGPCLLAEVVSISDSSVQVVWVVYQRFFLRWAWPHRLSTSQTESARNRNRKRAHPDESRASFAALCLLMESLYFNEMFRKRQKDHMREPPATDAVTSLAADRHVLEPPVWMTTVTCAPSCLDSVIPIPTPIEV